MKKTLIAMILIAATANAYARPPPDSSNEFHEWFMSLKIPGSNMMCCSESDCRFVLSRFNQDTNHFEAFIDRDKYYKSISIYDSVIVNDWNDTWIKNYGDISSMWISIPNKRVKIEVNNPTGHAILCWTPYLSGSAQEPDGDKGVYCFIPMIGT